MTRLITFLAPLLMLGAAHAMEVKDAPLPEPNYLGIFIFLLLFVGGSAWYLWKVMRTDNKNKQDKAAQSKP
jgi:drug/metabolite transporter (DMT)-like permease